MGPRLPLLASAAFLVAPLLAFPAQGGMRTDGIAGPPVTAVAAKGPTPAESRPTMTAKPASLFVGKVVTVRGNKSIAEIEGGARKGEKFTVYDERLRKCGECTVTLALDRELFVLEPTDGKQADVGDQLARAAAK